MANTVSADEEDRERRRFDPAAREFRSTAPPSGERTTPEKMDEPPKAPIKRPPAKLPSAPPIRGQDTVDAAHQALEHLIDPARKKKPS